MGILTRVNQHSKVEESQIRFIIMTCHAVVETDEEQCHAVVWTDEELCDAVSGTHEWPCEDVVRTDVVGTDVLS